MKNSKTKGLLSLILAIAAVVVFGFLGYQTMDEIKLGLDLAGGVSITYQTVKEDPTDEEMSDTIYKLQQRVQNYSTEAEVYQEGSNRINIDIPGVSDANTILEELGKPGSLVFSDETGKTVLDGTKVTSAKAGMYQDDTTGMDKYVVSLTFNEEGKQAFAEATKANIGKPIFIIYDNQVVSSPIVQNEITQGSCEITGIETFEMAENLASTIRIGSLSLELEELRSNVVGAKLGSTAISTSLKAGAIGFALVAVFMIAVYLIPGLASVIALCLYVGLILILLSAFEITLTLPGVAGIILSIGMAVDANVIIFTRIKEEIAVGKTVKSAIKTGFQKALSAIVFVPVRDTLPFTVRSPKEESSAFVMVRESSVVAPVEVTAPAFVTIMSAPDTTCPLSVVLSSRIVPSDVIASSTIVPSFASRLATCAVLPFTDA